MSRQLKVISHGEIHTHSMLTPEKRFRHFRNIVSSVLQDAEDMWGKIWDEFQGSVTDGVMILPEAERGEFIPGDGWPRLLENMWELKHYLDYAKRFCDKG